MIDTLQNELQQTNIRGTLKEAQVLSLQYNLPIQYTCKKVQEGWNLKPKEMMQILWERGFIDPNKSVRDYTLNGRKSIKGDNNIIPGTSLRELVRNLPDFKTETTLLQFQAQQFGVQVRCNPKYHPEIAGEAVEFCWALSKNKYRCHKLEEKRTKEKFLA